MVQVATSVSQFSPPSLARFRCNNIWRLCFGREVRSNREPTGSRVEPVRVDHRCRAEALLAPWLLRHGAELDESMPPLLAERLACVNKPLGKGTNNITDHV